MKTLIDEINDIKNAKTSKASKKRALVELGLMPYEVAYLMSDLPANKRLSFTFGVEIECFVPRHSIRVASEQTGFNYAYEGYNHNDGHSHFKFVSDGSLTGLDDPIECVSPILKGSAGKTMLKKACTTLNTAGARVNRSCGLHVHIGASDLTEEQYSNVFVNYAYLEGVIDTFMPRSRRDNTYAATLTDHRSKLSEQHTIEGVCNTLNRDRYHKVNPVSYRRHKTIEFRQHGGTTDFKKITNWVSFCGKLVDWSKKNRLTAPIDNIDSIDFLTNAEKTFFKARVAELSNN